MPGYAQEDEHMREMEREAYEVGNLIFRDWEDNLKDKGGKPLFTSTVPYVPAPTSGIVGGRLVEENKMKNKLTKSELQKIIAEEFGTLVEQGTGPFGSDPEKFAKGRAKKDDLKEPPPEWFKPKEPVGRDPREKPDTRGFATKPDMSKMMDIPKPPPGLEADSPSAPLSISLDIGGEIEKTFDIEDAEEKARDAAGAGAKRRGWRKTNRTIADAAEGKGMLYRGHRGEGVKELQRLLGFPEPVDGKFGEDTQNAVIKFQKDFGAKRGTNGVVGTETGKALQTQSPEFELPEPPIQMEPFEISEPDPPSRAERWRQRAANPSAYDRFRQGFRGEEDEAPRVLNREVVADWWRRSQDTSFPENERQFYLDRLRIANDQGQIDWERLEENKKMNKSELQQIIREVIQETIGRGSLEEDGGGDLEWMVKSAYKGAAAKPRGGAAEPYEAGLDLEEDLQDIEGLSEDSEGEETYHYGEDEGEDKKRLSKGDLSRGHKAALKKDMAYDEEHEDRREKGTHFRESFFPKDRSVRDKARKELNEGLMKRWGFTKKEK